MGFAGRVVCIGYTTQEVTFPTKLWVQKELTILGSRNANPGDFEAVIKFLQTNNLDEKTLVSKIVNPDEAGNAMKQWSEIPGDILKILVKFD